MGRAAREFPEISLLPGAERLVPSTGKEQYPMASNHGVVYLGPNKVEVQSIDYPKMQNPQGKSIEHGVILRIVSTNICGSDQHMVRGRTTAPKGIVLGHEITGESSRRAKTSSSSTSATSSRCPSTWPADAVVPAASATPASA
jgi:Alcohol dehydrogenase GroES-like domain